jgi:hypothetical protein
MECRVRSIPLNRYVKYFDGQWQGMIAASDGACYFGASTHSPLHGSSFFKFEPGTGNLTVLAEDMTRVCGEDLAKTGPQGKIHSPIVESEGWLYFTTHLSNYWDEAQDRYTGAHVIGYELSTGRFRDFGIVRQRYTIYSAINIDPKHRKLYVLAVPFARADVEKDGSHLYQIDLDTGAKTDLGLVGQKQRGCTFWFFIDDRGDCWFTLWKNHWPISWDHADLYQYDARARAITCYKDVLPRGTLAPDGAAAPAKLASERSWSWAEALPGGKECLFTTGCLGGGDEQVWIFDPRKSIEKGKAFRPLAYIGSTFLGNAFDGKDRLYFVQYKDLAAARSYWAEAVRDYPREDICFDDAIHLRSIRIGAASDNRVIEHGRIVDEENRRVTMIESLAADRQGNVFMHGTWDSLAPEESTHQYVWPELLQYYDEMGYKPLLKSFKGAANYQYKVMQRGQFFSHVKIDQRG